MYLPGNWPAPFGIVLVLDRLSAMMLVLTSGVAAGVGSVATATGTAPECISTHCSSSQLMRDLAGAFTADLFNLFVFFEIMLAASARALCCTAQAASGSRRTALHRAINLAASSLFPDWCVHAAALPAP